MIRVVGRCTVKTLKGKRCRQKAYAGRFEAVKNLDGELIEWVAKSWCRQHLPKELIMSIR